MLFGDVRPSSALVAAIARLQGEKQDQENALEAERESLTGPERLAAEARARAEADRIEREIATLETIRAIQTVAQAAAQAANARAEEAARREVGIVAMTDRLLDLTRWLVALAALTLAAAIATLILSA